MNTRSPCKCGHAFFQHVWKWFSYRYSCHACACSEFMNDVAKDAPEQLEFVGE